MLFFPRSDAGCLQRRDVDEDIGGSAFRLDGSKHLFGFKAFDGIDVLFTSATLDAVDREISFQRLQSQSGSYSCNRGDPPSFAQPIEEDPGQWSKLPGRIALQIRVNHCAVATVPHTFPKRNLHR